MKLTQVSLNTLIPQIPSIIAENNQSLKNYLDVFYDELGGVIIKPINTAGKIKGGTGEFVNVVVDNLTVKKQWTNLYDNFNTADYVYYKTSITPIIDIRESNLGWPYEDPSNRFIDTEKPYYKIDNDGPISLNTPNLSQVVGILFDTSVNTVDKFQIVLDPCSGQLYEVDPSVAGTFYAEFICTEVDPSWGSSWTQYKFGIDKSTAASVSGSAEIFGVGTMATIPMFYDGNTIMDSPIKMEGTILRTDSINADGSIAVAGKILDIYEPSLNANLAVPNTVGGILAGTLVSELAGLTHDEIINLLLFPAEPPTRVVNSAGLVGISYQTLEVGTNFIPTVTGSYNPGVITNGDGTVGPNLTGDASLYKFKIPNGTIDASIVSSNNSEIYTFSSQLIGLSTYNWSVDIDYNIGTGNYYDNFGEISNIWDAERVAGTKTASSSNVLGRHYYWYGIGTNGSAPVDSAGVRLLSDKNFLSVSNTVSFDIAIPATTQSVYFYVPTGKTIYVETSDLPGVDIIGSFDAQATETISLIDPNGDSHTYDFRESYIGLNGYPDPVTYTVVIS